jgi:predicted RNA binding protein YcfA (HicA-like mRNA interferase family)
VLFNQRGSHRLYHHLDGRVIAVVKPHGHRKTCHPQDVRRFLEVLGL